MMTVDRFAGAPASVTEAMAALIDSAQRHVVLVRSGPHALGTGIVWRAEGVVVTNAHVVGHGQLEVTLLDGRAFPAQVLLADPEVDLAILQIPQRELPTAMLGDSRSVRVGELVFALGNPWGMRTVTAGIVSGFGRAMTHNNRELTIIRSDVRLAPGNSGGPMINVRGEAIGINTLVVGGDLGVAIPSHEIDALIADAFDRQVTLGVSVQPVGVSASLRTAAKLEQEAGLLVVELRPDGPAARAGLAPGDLLVDLDGVPLDRPRALMQALRPHRPGEKVPLRLLRGGRRQQVEVELEPLERAA